MFRPTKLGKKRNNFTTMPFVVVSCLRHNIIDMMLYLEDDVVVCKLGKNLERQKKRRDAAEKESQRSVK